VKLWSRFVWFLTGISNGILWTPSWTFGILKMPGISWVSEQLLASQVLCCLGMVSSIWFTQQAAVISLIGWSLPCRRSVSCEVRTGCISITHWEELNVSKDYQQGRRRGLLYLLHHSTITISGPFHSSPVILPHSLWQMNLCNRFQMEQNCVSTSIRLSEAMLLLLLLKVMK
jgi:hypothetical protein